MRPAHRGRNPADLSDLQKWFCRAIRTPESRFDSVARAAGRYLTEGQSGQSRDRLLIYVRDYWARCKSSLREDFPGLAKMLGEKRFAAWSERYLVKHPSTSYTLRNLGAKLFDFMRRRYRGRDRGAALNMIRFEWAKIEAFDNPQRPSFDPAKLSEAQKSRLAERPLELQPHLSLLEMRRARSTAYTVVYRRENRVYHKKIVKPFFRLLQKLHSGATLSSACASAARKLSAAETRVLERNIGSWFQNGVANGWFCAPKGDGPDERHPAMFSAGFEFAVQNRLVAAPSGSRFDRVGVLRHRKGKTRASR